MKILYCLKCNDMIRLSCNPKACSCGESVGLYLKDGLHAVYFGEKAIPLGINNHQFTQAVRFWQNSPYDVPGPEFDMFIISKDSDRIKKVKNREELSAILEADKG